MTSVPPPETLRPTTTTTTSDIDAPDHSVSLWVAPAAVMLGLGLGIFSAIMAQVIGQAFGSKLSHPSPAVSLVSDFLFDLSFVAAALYFSATQRILKPGFFGFRRTPLKPAIVTVVVAAIAYYTVTYLYGLLLSLHGKDKLPSELGVNKHTAALVAATVFVCVVAPICEEFFFRGFFFGILRQMRVTIAGREVGVIVAALITSVLFGLAHTGSASPQYLVPLGFLGLVLCAIRVRTRSLYPCMALHSINNSLALGVNQVHWSALEVIGLMVGSLVVIGLITAPLAVRTPLASA